MADHSKRVIEIICDVTQLDESEIALALPWADSGLDSLDVVECIMEVEKEFQIAIADEKSESMRSVSDLISYVNENVN